MTASNQGMRQPQWGGVQSRLELTAPRPLCARHRDQWRRRDGGPWICAVCHPPAAGEEQIERRRIAVEVDAG